MELSQIASVLTKNLLNEKIVEDKEHTSDRIDGDITNLAANLTQHDVAQGGPVDSVRPITLPTNAALAKNAYVEHYQREIYLARQEWSSTTGEFNVLNAFSVTDKIFQENTPQRKLRDLWQFFRANIELTIQVNAPTGATGGLLFYYAPHHATLDDGKWSKALVYTLPHVIINLGSTTTATLKVPYMYHQNFMNTRESNLGKFYTMVLSQYSVPNGMLTTVDITYFGRFTDLTVTNPTFDQSPGPNKKSRSTRFKYTRQQMILTESDGTANMSNSSTVSLNISSALMGERIYIDRSCTGQWKPTRDLLDICRVPCNFINGNYTVDRSVFTINSNNQPGTNVYKANFSINDMGYVGMMARYFSGWSGTLELHVTMFASVMHKGRIAIVVNQSKNLQDTISLEQLNRLQYTIYDIGLNSTAVVSIPFLSDQWMRRSNSDVFLRVNIIVINRLTFSATAASAIKGLVRVAAGKDFKFYFPKPADVALQAPTSWGSEMDLRDPLEDDAAIQDHFDETEHEQMDGESKAAVAGLGDAGNSGTLGDIMHRPTPVTGGKTYNFKQVSPISYTNVFAFFGRSWFVADIEVTGREDNIYHDVYTPKMGHGSMMNAFVFLAAEPNFTIANDTDSVLMVAHSWDTWHGDIEGSGVLAIPPRRIATFTAPFYSISPVRTTGGEQTFGRLMFTPGKTAGRIRIYMSLKNPAFFVPRPMNRKVTSLLYVTQPHLYSRSLSELEANVHNVSKGELAVAMRQWEPPSHITKAQQYVKQNKQMLLELSGDVELNPGPTLKRVYRCRGLYKHYGVTDGLNVFHINTEDILWTSITGNATVRMDPLDGSWIEDGVVSMVENVDVEALVGNHIKFTGDSTCEHWANHVLGLKAEYTQSAALEHLALIVASLSLASTIKDQSITDFAANLGSVLSQTLENKLLQRMLRFLIRLTCYAILFCHSPGLITGASVAALIWMDISDLNQNNSGWFSGFIQACVAGDVSAMYERIAEAISEEDEAELVASACREGNQMFNQGFDEFNKFSLAFKNVDWWLDKLKELYQKVMEWIRPSKEAEFAKTVKIYKEDLAYLFQRVQELNQKMKDPYLASKPCNKIELAELTKITNFWQTGFAKWAPRHPLAPYMAQAQKTLNKMMEQRTNPSSMFRQEPVGILIRSDPGQGKSFLATLLSKRVAQNMKWDKQDIFNHPTGSKHFDGYCGQSIHLIDDLGQTSDDEEYSLLCQCMSSVNFSPPMAKLEEKTIWYVSKLVIATTNREGFVTKTINTPEALQRRFTIQLDIKANPKFTINGRLDPSNHMAAIQAGDVWVDELGHKVDIESLVEKITRELIMRNHVTNEWATFVNQSPTVDEWADWVANVSANLASRAERIFEADFEEEETVKSKFMSMVSKAIDKFSKFVSRNTHWFIFASALATIIGLIMWYRNSKVVETDQVYAGLPTATAPKVTKFKKNTPETPIVDQGPLDELAHIRKVAIRLVADQVQVFGLAVGGDRLLVYAHSYDILNNANTVHVFYKGNAYLLENPEFTQLNVNGRPTDLAIIKCNIPTQFANGLKYIKKDLSTDGLLFWNTKNGAYSMQARKIRPIGDMCTANGTYAHAALAYECSTTEGTCGGLLLCKVNGMYHIAGMHTAGNGYSGRAVVLPIDQGIVMHVEDMGLAPVHLPSKTKYKPSPLHGMVPVTMEPAALSDKDPRVEEPPSKQVLEKHVGNVFKPSNKELYAAAVVNVRRRLIENIGVHPRLSIEEAVFDLKNPIDLSTSPGHKYTTLGLRKRDLIDGEKRWINPLLVQHVNEMLSNLGGSEPLTYFTTHFKDELRSIEKVRLGKTRVIEASQLDYTVVFRMIFGRAFDLLCLSDPLDTGFAVGMNPYYEWTPLVRGLYDNIYDFDFKAYDGSLSSGLMVDGLYVLSGVCENPNELMELGADTVWSMHHYKFDYMTAGTNPSGTPFTTVLNCAINCILIEYYMLTIDTPYVAVTYGDDLLVSTPCPVEFQPYKEMLKEEFGMTITPADKGEVFKPATVETFQFLKRTTHWLTADTAVGVLDVDNMLQHIMWTKGEQAFQQQLQSFEIELAMHGAETYQYWRDKIKKYAKIELKPYDYMKQTVNLLVFGTYFG